MDTQTITTPTWRITLPADWSDQKDQDSGMHFASADGSCALYIATWTMAPGSARPAADLTEDFVAYDLGQLAAMEGHDWRTLEKTVECGDGRCIAIIDSHDQAQQYRIVSKILARDGQVVRATFHDYECIELAESQELFAPLVASLDFNPT